MSAINYPTYRPVGGSYPGGYSGGGVDRKSESPMHGMRSTSRLGEQLAADGDYVPLPFSGDDYSSPARMALAPNRAPVSISAAYANFLASLPVISVVDGVKIYDQDVAAGYWGSANMPYAATWAGFLVWFAAQGDVAWYENDSPIGDGYWVLMLLALLYAVYVAIRKNYYDEIH